MARKPRVAMEFKDHSLPPEFPILVLSGDECGITDRPGTALHFHNCLELGLCHSGRGILEFQDMKLPFRPGDVTLIASGTPHRLCFEPGTRGSWSYLFMDTSYLFDPAAGDLALSEMYKGFLYNAKLLVSREQEPIFEVFVNEALREMREQKTGYQYCVSSLLEALLGKLSRYLSESGSAPAGNPFPIAPALRYIDTHYMDDFKMDDLAALCKMSTSYFRRIFTETMGGGPLDYLNRTRIQRACTLLQLSQMSILDVCEAVGFLSLSSFNRHFSAMMGMPPTAWRNRLNAEQGNTLYRSYRGGKS